MKVLKICCSEWVNENRDKRELSVCQELGVDVVVLAKGNMKDKGRIDWVDGFEVRRYSTRPLGVHIPNSINRIISLFTWGRYARKIGADIISGHDLSGLTIGWISTWFVPKSKRPKLVYDSHEFEIGRTAKRSKFMIWATTHWERFMLKKSSMVMMVNDSIADEVQKIHKLKNRPVVVRNIPNRWEINRAECEKIREQYINQMGKDISLILIYHGAIGIGRGIENLIRAAEEIPEVGVVILGNISDEEYFAFLSERLNKSPARKRIIIHEAVPLQELYKYLGASDIGICAISPVGKSYYYALPNKLFENIQAGNPVIVSDLPEMKRMVTKYNLGMVCKVDDVQSLVYCIKKLIQDTDIIDSYRKNALNAKKELCWEKEKQVLLNAYQSMM